MDGRRREDGLSEVIGFLMIVTLLSILFSMYLLYVVPLQGRDAEISHMSGIKEVFQNIKSDIDTLVVNNRIDIPVEQMVSLGTGQASSSGSLGFIPIQSFSGSEGVLSVSEDSDQIQILVRGTKTLSDPASLIGAIDNITDLTLSPTPIAITIRPYLFNITYQAGSLTNPYVVNISDHQGQWKGTITTVPHYSMNLSDISNRNATGYMSVPAYPRITYDLTMSTIKAGQPAVSDTVIARDIAATDPYIINLYEWAYGLIGDIPQESTLDIQVDGLSPNSSTLKIKQHTYTFTQYPRDIQGRDLTTVHPIGKISYSSSNRYWINQEYLYQGGGVFVKQLDGSSVLYYPPIIIRKDDDENILVDITDIQIKNNEMISGSQVNPIYARISSIDNTFDSGDYLSDEVPNANYVWVQVTSDNYSRWVEAFGRIASLAKKDKRLKNDIAVRNTSSTADLFIGSGVESIPENPSVSDITTALNKASPNVSVQYRHATVPVNLQTTSI